MYVALLYISFAYVISKLWCYHCLQQYFYSFPSCIHVKHFAVDHCNNDEDEIDFLVLIKFIASAVTALTELNMQNDKTGKQEKPQS